VVDDPAHGVVATGAWAGVVTLVVTATGKGSVTVRVDDTLRSPASVGIPEVFRSAGALTAAASDCRVCVGTTGVWVAGVPWWERSWGGEGVIF
jgi:hypothetical protein